MEDSKEEVPTNTSSYASIHCAICAYGWLRRGTPGTDGRTETVLWRLLDLEAVWEQMCF